MAVLQISFNATTFSSAVEEKGAKKN
jgi:hypothetical protein